MKNVILLLVFYLSTLGAFAQPIGGPNVVCTGSTITVTDASGGGTWASSNSAVGSIGSSTGLIIGISVGVTTITYNFSGGGFTTYPVTVYATPAPISGASSVCAGQTIVLTDPTPGNSWSSSNPCATVSVTGVVTGVTAPCVATITYGNPACYVTHVVSVNASPAAITGTMSICGAVNTTTLSDPTSGGTFSSGSPCVSVAALTGVCTGVTAPCTGTVTYTLADGCYTTATVSVFPVPVVTVSASQVLCSQSNTAAIIFTSTVPGTTFSWTNTNPSIGLAAAGTGSAIAPFTTINSGSTPVVTTITVTPSANGCPGTPQTVTITVNPLPPLCTVTGGGVCCPSGTGVHIGLSCSAPGISYQLMCGASPVGAPVAGTGAAIDFGAFCTACVYTVVATNLVTGCSSTMTGSATVTLGTLPPLCTVTGGGYCCAGSAGVPVGLSCSTPGINYQLYCGTTPVGAPLSGTGSALNFGLFCSNCIYKVVATNATSGCSDTMNGSANVTMAPLPVVYNVSGGGSYCDSSAGCPHIYLSNSQAGVTYKVYCGTTVVASMGGTGGPLDLGPQCVSCTYTVTGTDNITGCVNNMLGSATVSITAPPAPISGPISIVCPAISITLTDPTGGGSWSSSNTACGSISTTGVVTATNAGPGPCTTTIKYQTSPGCFVTTTVNIPYCGGGTIIRDTTSCCVDSIIINTGYNPVTNTAIAAHADGTPPATDPNWIVSSISLDAVSEITGMGSPYVAVSTPSGNADLIPQNGDWSCTYPLTGWISCLNADFYHTDYGVYTATMTRPFTLCHSGNIKIDCWILHDNNVPSVKIDGTLIYAEPSPGAPDATCPGYHIVSTLLLAAGPHTLNIVVQNHDASFGSYDNPAGLDLEGTISVADDSAGLVNESKALHCCCAGCEITGNTHICAGGTTSLSSCSSCSWSSSNSSIAMVGSCTGVVTGISGGTVTITHVSDIGCSTFTTVIVDSLPRVCTVTGGGSYCTGGPCPNACPHVSLGCSQTGVNYQLSCGSTLVTPVLAGTGSALDFGPECGPCTYTIKATNSIGCTSNMSGSVTSAPIAPCPISGSATSICVGNNLALTTSCSPAPPCPWSSSDASVATVSCTGNVHGVGSGVVTISYTSAAGCITTYNVTVNAVCPIAGPATLCTGSTYIYSVAPCTGGTWLSSTPSVGPINLMSGLFTGAAPGYTVISYTTTSGCPASFTVNVLAIPSVTPDPVTICVGTSATLNPTPSGGTWTGTPCVSMTPSGTSEIITGLFAPCAGSITYSLGGCSVIVPVSVNAACPITGPATHTICAGNSFTLSTTCSGGTWSSSNPGCVSVGSGTGLCTSVGGISTPCLATITYTSASGCTSTYTVTNNPTPAIYGPPSICMGSSITLTNSGGGSWSMTPTPYATFNTITGVLTSVSAWGGPFTVTITYSLPTGCFATKVITIYPSTLSYTTTICAGQTTTVCVTPPNISTWAWTPAGIVSETGIGSCRTITGLAGGSATMVYTVMPSGCPASVTVSVNPVPIISGPSAVCTGSSISETVIPPVSGVWSLTPSGPYASLSSWLGPTTNINGLTAGLVTLKYTTSTNCPVYKTINVNKPPIAGSILWSPSNIVCVGSTINFGNFGAIPSTGGTWTMSCPYATMNTALGTLTGNFWGWWPFSHSCILTYTTPNVPGCGTTSVSNTFTVELCKHKGSKEEGDAIDDQPATELKIFPNPSQGSFTVNLVTDKNESAEVRVTNILGETVRKFTTVTNKDNQVRIDTAPGIYLVSVATADGNYLAKVVVE